MNKKALVVFGSLLTVAMFVLPMSIAFAEKPEKLPLTWLAGPNTFTPIESRVTGKIQHGSQTNDYSFIIISWSTIASPPMMAPLQDPDNCLLGDGATLTGSYSVNRDTMKGVIHYKVEFTLGEPVQFGPVILEADEGTFEGTLLLKGELEFREVEELTVKLNTGTWEGVLRGTGAYRGWKIVQNSQVVDGSFIGEAYIFKR